MCAGALIFMKNNCKGAHHADYGDALDTVQQDAETVFQWAQEFLDHHTDPQGWAREVRNEALDRTLARE